MGDINKRHLCFVKQDRLENLFTKINHILPMRLRFLLSVILTNEELIWIKLVWSNTCTLNTTRKFNTSFEALYWQKTMLMKTLEVKSSRSYNKRWCGTFLWRMRSTGHWAKCVRVPRDVGRLESISYQSYQLLIKLLMKNFYVKR